MVFALKGDLGSRVVILDPLAGDPWRTKANRLRVDQSPPLTAVLHQEEPVNAESLKHCNLHMPHPGVEPGSQPSQGCGLSVFLVGLAGQGVVRNPTRNTPPSTFESTFNEVAHQARLVDLDITSGDDPGHPRMLFDERRESSLRELLLSIIKKRSD